MMAPRSHLRPWLAALAAALVIDGLLLLPIVARFQSLPITWIAVEAVLLPAVFALLPVRRETRWLGTVAAAIICLALVLGLAEAATWNLLYRPLNLYLDLELAAFGHDLLVTNLGWPWALAGELIALACLLGAGWGLRGLLISARGAANARWAMCATGLLATLAAAALLSATVLHYWPSSFAPTARLIREQIERAMTTRDAMQRFAAELDQSARRPEPLPGLEGIDVIVGFIESYGVSVHRQPRYARAVEPGLSALHEAVRRRDLHVVTGRLESPVQGGQSWLAHGSLISGLWLDNQIRYDLMLRHDAPTLIDDFRATGHRTAGIFPAITQPWPDGERLGYDRVYAAADMDYAGPRLNWVTMPDQYTWSWFQRRVRASSHGPMFAELALISSHAPWTPVIPVVEDWQRVTDGSLFERWRGAGPEPSQLWRDPERVRRFFGRSMDYALQVAAGYAQRYADNDTLLIILGDHQPAPLITGDGASRAVPVHIVSGDRRLLKAFRRHGFRPGLSVPRGGRSARMSALRGWLIQAFGGSAAAE